MYYCVWVLVLALVHVHVLYFSTCVLVHMYCDILFRVLVGPSTSSTVMHNKISCSVQYNTATVVDSSKIQVHVL